MAAQKEQLNLLMGRDVRTLFDTTGVPEGELAAIDLEARNRGPSSHGPKSAKRA